MVLEGYPLERAVGIHREHDLAADEIMLSTLVPSLADRCASLERTIHALA